jgi:hypothetical protein
LVTAALETAIEEVAGAFMLLQPIIEIMAATHRAVRPIFEVVFISFP